MQSETPSSIYMDTDEIEQRCMAILDQLTAGESPDSAHDRAHILRVATTAKEILKNEDADHRIVIAAAWLHDCVVLSKDHPKRNNASKLAAEKASALLRRDGFPESLIDKIAHAIEAHSYSAGIEPQSIEAKIVRDADRLDALGAVGIARCLMVGGMLNRPLYDPEDPFCKHRNPDDQTFTLDHFYEKLFKLPETMHTESAKMIAVERVAFMKRFLEQMQREI
jgi:uncharacterized protein